MVYTTFLGVSDKISYRISYESTLTDLQTATKTGWAFIASTIMQNVTDKPSDYGSNGSCFLGVLGGRGSQDLIQVLIKQGDNRVWLRGLWNGTIVADWKQLAFVTTQ